MARNLGESAFGPSKGPGSCGDRATGDARHDGGRAHRSIVLKCGRPQGLLNICFSNPFATTHQLNTRPTRSRFGPTTMAFCRALKLWVVLSHSCGYPVSETRSQCGCNRTRRRRSTPWAFFALGALWFGAEDLEHSAHAEVFLLLPIVFSVKDSVCGQHH